MLNEQPESQTRQICSNQSFPLIICTLYKSTLYITKNARLHYIFSSNIQSNMNRRFGKLPMSLWALGALMSILFALLVCLVCSKMYQIFSLKFSVYDRVYLLIPIFFWYMMRVYKNNRGVWISDNLVWIILIFPVVFNILMIKICILVIIYVVN